VDTDCAEGYHCDEAGATCEADGAAGDGCITDTDCAAAYHCNEATGVCAPDGAAGDGCITDTDCAAGYHCDEVAGSCEADGATGDGCVADADCAAAYHCDETAGTCEPDGDPGAECVDNSDCAEGYNCLGGTCALGGNEGDSCASEADCEPAMHCDETQGTCVPDSPEDGPCTVASDCVAGLYCVNDVCDPQAPEGTPCTADSECQDNLHCDVTCTPDVADGGACDETGDCVSGNCNNSLCCASGKTCCASPATCPGAAPSVCGSPATCQGTRTDATCVESACGTTTVDDDTACDSSVTAKSCTPYADVKCSGAADQGLPAACAATCATDAACASDHVCVASKCEPVICSVAGSAGAVGNCHLNLARGALAFKPAVQLELILQYITTDLLLDSLEVCGPLIIEWPCTVGGDECDIFAGEVPDVYCDPMTLLCSECKAYGIDDLDAKLRTGHTIETCAQPPANCLPGRFKMLFFGSESLPLTDAHLDAGFVIGQPEFVNVRFELLKNLPAGSKVTIGSSGFVASDEMAKSLPLSVQHSTAPNPDHFIATGTSL